MSDINIIYKEIEQLSQKSTISGTEKIVVSDTEFVTPSQIAGLADVSGKQDTLVSGINIKTINHLSILGSGNLNIEGGGGGGGTVEWGNIGGTLADQNDLKQALDAKAGTDVTGSLSNLTTTDKSNLVAAINEAAQSGGGTDAAVLYTEQNLTAAQKAQARANIAAAAISDVGNPVVSISSPTPSDGTVIFTHKNGDTATIDLNHQHPSYPKYLLCPNQAAYDNIATKDDTMLYLIPATV